MKTHYILVFKLHLIVTRRKIRKLASATSMSTLPTIQKQGFLTSQSVKYTWQPPKLPFIGPPAGVINSSLSYSLADTLGPQDQVLWQRGTLWAVDHVKSLTMSRPHVVIFFASKSTKNCYILCKKNSN